jgi:CheY-like chemotaxis protein
MSPLSHLHRGSYIVVADEKPVLLDMIVETLRAEDHCVFRAYDGKAALELTLALQRVDLLITDTRTPGMQGPELIQAVRERLPTLPVLYIKNLESPGGAQKNLPPDVPVLAEPFTSGQLLAAVRPLLVKD